MRNILLIACFLISIHITAQNKVISGIVTDSLGTALESASVMANPIEKNNQLKFSIADENGMYRLILQKNIGYIVTVSYVGFFDKSFVVKPEDDIEKFDFRLKKSNEILKEIIINYDVKPLVIKKDTMIYNLSSFTNGGERKLKEQLKKLPGVEVDRDGNVTLQGKRVTTFLVDNRDFFGGGTKLGVENIPADAVDKVEFIDHFNEVGFLKEVSGSQQLALNIKLKEDKKEFLFGDVEAASGPVDFYKLHSNLFYYGGKTMLGFIGDVNNLGDRILDYSDIARFDSGSSFIENNSQVEDLFSFASNNRDVASSKSKFSAGNFSHRFNEKLEVLGYAIFSQVDNKMENQTEINYFQNNAVTIENRANNSDTNNSFFLGRLKLKYKTNKREQWLYNANFKLSDRHFSDQLISQTNLQTLNFRTFSSTNRLGLTQFFEWHKSYSNSHTATFVVNHIFEDTTIDNNWNTNSPFLSGLIPLVSDQNFNVTQNLRLKSNTIDFLFKNYWVIDNFNHFYFSVANTYIDGFYSTDDKQILSDSTENNFTENGFGNNLSHQYNDLSGGMDYKFLFRKWTNKLSLHYHNYLLKNNNFQVENNLNRTFFEPQFESKYEFSKGESILFNYKLSNEFQIFSKYASRLRFISYNSLFQGNQDLFSERYNTYSLYYKKVSLLNGIIVNANLNYNSKSDAIRSEVNLQGINQVTNLVQTNNLEDNILFNGSITKEVYKLNIGFNWLLTSMNFLQFINGLENKVNRNGTNLGIEIKTKNSKWPFVTLKYNKSFDQFRSRSFANFETDILSFDADFVINSQFVFKTFYEYQRNRSSASVPVSFNTLNLSLGYNPIKSTWKFEISARNVLNNLTRNSNTFSDFSSSNQTIAVLPRVVMLDVTYKL